MLRPVIDDGCRQRIGHCEFDVSTIALMFMPGRSGLPARIGAERSASPNGMRAPPLGCARAGQARCVVRLHPVLGSDAPGCLDDLVRAATPRMPPSRVLGSTMRSDGQAQQPHEASRGAPG